MDKSEQDKQNIISQDLKIDKISPDQKNLEEKLKQLQQLKQGNKNKDKSQNSFQIVKKKAFHRKPAYNEIYIKNKTNISVYIKRAHELIQKGVKIIVLHGLTAAIPKCVKVAINLTEQYSDLNYKVDTTTEITQIEKIQNNNGQKNNNEIKEKEQIKDEEKEIDIEKLDDFGLDVNFDKQLDQDSNNIVYRTGIRIILSKDLDF
ncbi:hypothetical protein PPERSA_09256 [Pseudocohnilembus persalinus]|uniref:DNA/RNA-binding protein Alba-like domain-containing protein n=1 Tax=Pseudocohnilembus persalinus TaxID=266149 RepID=A0A0V0QMA0_PSEPJ|nr:hypothetical protein PPERSA_09256 [Pseudocohnilembus persalinus]|eukprot:KRX03244.1 hypothetical protein PPERSA_09256 [Pseudocohnilembus persalinus]